MCDGNSRFSESANQNLCTPSLPGEYSEKWKL